MIVLFPMGGKGARFVEAGYTTPKPLLPVGKDTLISLAIGSYPTNQKYWFIIREELVKDVWSFVPEHSLTVIIKQETSGPIETILSSSIVGKIEKEPEEDLLIADCDSFLNPLEMESAFKSFRDSGADGGCTVRKTSNPGCSFAAIQDKWITETREKDPFTEWSTTGPYWFKSGKQFLECSSEAVKSGVTSISPVYNWLIKKGGKVRAFPVKTFVHLGTPKEYERYLNGSVCPTTSTK